MEPERRRWRRVVLINAILGYLAILPLGIVVLTLRGTVFADPGRVRPDAGADSSAGGNVTVGLVMACAVIAAFTLVNRYVRYSSGLRGPRFWLVSAAVAVLPFTAALLWPGRWADPLTW
ncbi:hypothetical protein [Actinokineospora enzanensis]|uniref:hypothetical protein n=1 Tax=Actinokineospora enzanensis TaxID=155975 RepID=UPI0003688713|nr:hypothetical protein [Actinokineospora enzanensis]